MNKKNIIVSTLICTYNAERFIDDTLDSVVRQTLEDQEILMLDNNSKDATLEIIKKYQEKDPRIKLFEMKENIGAYNGLNYLLDRAEGRYIAIQDHDDIWHPEKLERQVAYLDKYPEYIGSGTGSLMYYGKSQVGFLYDNREYDTTKVIHTSIMYRNTELRYDTANDFLCDGYFMQCILTKGEPLLHVLPEPLTLHYYKEDGTNYSELWFKINPRNMIRYYRVYGYHWYYTFLLVYILIFKLLPFKLRYKYNFWLLMKVKKARSIEVLREEHPFLKDLLRYYG